MPEGGKVRWNKFTEQGEIKISKSIDYNSNNATQLDIVEMKKLLLRTQFIQTIIRAKDPEAKE